MKRQFCSPLVYHLWLPYYARAGREKVSLWWRQTRRLLVLFFCVAVFWMPALVSGQSQDLALDRGSAGLAQALARLPLTTRVLFITAHPDDEPAGLLTFFSRGLLARTALLSLTRGEGGQNLISSDLFEALGLLRTGELLAADEYYGVEQYFTRAFDFGFSRSAEETLRLWDREAVLSDMVRVIRRLRPDVIISVWKGDAQDGHGHHQASGILAREAFRTSGDHSHFPEQLLEGLEPWQAERFYVLNPAENRGLLKIDTGEYVPLFGASFQQIGAKGYSLHRTQGMGSSYAPTGTFWLTLGPIFPGTSTARAVTDGFRDPGWVLSEQARSPLFREFRSALYDLPMLLKANDPQQTWFKDKLSSLKGLVEQAQQEFSPNDFSKSLRPLLKGLNLVREMRHRLNTVSLLGFPANHLDFLLEDKERDFLHAIELALGISLEAQTEEPVVTPGQSFMVLVHLVNRSSSVMKPRRIRLLTHPGWKSEIETVQHEPASLSPQDSLTVKFRVTVPPQETPTQLSWRREDPRGAMYSVTEKGRVNDALPLPPLQACLEYSISEIRSHATPPTSTESTKAQMELSAIGLTTVRAVEYLDSDRLKGTHRIPLLVVPPLFVNVSPRLQMSPLVRSTRADWISVDLIDNSDSGVDGQVRLQAPSGWSVKPGSYPFKLKEKGQSARFRFRVSPPEQVSPGRLTLKAVAQLGREELVQSCQIVSAFDLWKIPSYRRAESEIVTLDVRVPEKLNVGYIMGAGDMVPQILEQIGVPVTLLDRDELASGDLSRFSCIISGIRAYDVRNDLLAVNSRLLKYVAEGGVYVVQYNTPSAWNRSQYAPYPARIRSASDRVTDETTPVTLLDPGHPIFNSPNKITPGDFQGWVQERGLYFVQDRDSRFKALLSCHDPGEQPLDGGLLVAEYGKGLYVLTSYSWFRQLPAGVEGAIRIFANLVSLSFTRHEHHDSGQSIVQPGPGVPAIAFHLSPFDLFPYPLFRVSPNSPGF
jgi:LmbE family N-acetylglucosaminyl deacetylase